MSPIPTSSAMERRSPSYEVEVDGKTVLPPDHRLLIAVLLRAVRDFVNYRDAKKGSEQYKLAVDAAGWLFWNGREPMTFLKICETVGLDPENIRKITLTLTRDELLRMSTNAEETEEAGDEPVEE